MRFLRWITTPPDRSLQHLAMTARCCDHLTTIQAPENPWNVQVFHWHWCTQVRSLQEWCDYSRTQQQSSCFEMASVRHRHHFEWRLGQNSSVVHCASRCGMQEPEPPFAVCMEWRFMEMPWTSKRGTTMFWLDHGDAETNFRWKQNTQPPNNTALELDVGIFNLSFASD